MLEARGLCKSYGTRTAVADLSLEIRPGEILGLLGPNGAGKSTTVAMLCGLTAADKGEVVMRNVADAGAPAHAPYSTTEMSRIKRHVGLVPQDLALFDDIAARANLEVFGALYGLRGGDLAAKADAALDLVGLGDRARERPASFSGGMKRRLNIACALVHDPEIFLFDEPTVGVDPQSRNAIFENLETLRGRGKALLYATHYMEEAERLCDRIIIMDHGRIVAQDSLDGLLARLPAAYTLTVRVAAPVDLNALTQLPVIERATQDGEVLVVGVSNLAHGVPTLLEWLAGHGHTVAQLDTARANLEDVFLALTGRQLRD